MTMFKRFFFILSVFSMVGTLVGCSTNIATGQRQFTGLMSPQQEVQVGAQEHSKIMTQFGAYDNESLRNYVTEIGERVVAHTERSDVEYQFFLLDSPMVNAFALPGGYIYLTRGLLALANSEAEMASVLAHEAGHITGRHSAERYSRGVLATLGSVALSTAIGSDGVSQAIGLSTDLFMKSYSRNQEHQADDLGIRYLSRAEYPPSTMSAFLANLQAETALQAKLDGKEQRDPAASYFSTHPATQERVQRSIASAQQYLPQGHINRDRYLRKIDGMTFGDAADQGFVRGQSFYHPDIGFKFSVPRGFKIVNQPSQVLAVAQNGAVIIFDFAQNQGKHTPMAFLRHIWADGKTLDNAENIRIGGMAAATASLEGKMNGQVMDIRLVAIRWSDTQIARFHIGIPKNASQEIRRSLRQSSYSFARMNATERKEFRPYRIKIVTAQKGDTVASLSRRMAFDEFKEDYFRTYNGLGTRDPIIAGSLYKLIVE